MEVIPIFSLATVRSNISTSVCEPHHGDPVSMWLPGSLPSIGEIASSVVWLMTIISWVLYIHISSLNTLILLIDTKICGSVSKPDCMRLFTEFHNQHLRQVLWTWRAWCSKRLSHLPQKTYLMWSGGGKWQETCREWSDWLKVCTLNFNTDFNASLCVNGSGGIQNHCLFTWTSQGASNPQGI